MHSKREWKMLYREQIKMGICYCSLCEKLIEKPEDLTIDHKTPVSRQGGNWPGNWVPAHKWCNNEKGALTLEEYEQWKRLEFIRNGGKVK